MKMLAVLFLMLSLIGCTKKENNRNTVEAEEISDVTVLSEPEIDPVQEQLEHLDRLWEASMETIINETYEYEVPIRVYEEEKGYYLGFIVFAKTRKFPVDMVAEHL